MEGGIDESEEAQQRRQTGIHKCVHKPFCLLKLMLLHRGSSSHCSGQEGGGQHNFTGLWPG